MAHIRRLWAAFALAVGCGGSTHSSTSPTVSTGGAANGGVATGSGGVTTGISTAGSGGSSVAVSGVGGANTSVIGGTSTFAAAGGTFTSGGIGATGGSNASSAGGTFSSVARGGSKATGGGVGSSVGGTLSVTTGGKSMGGNSGATGGNTSHVDAGSMSYTCDGAACCQSLSLDSSSIWATIAGNNLSITILVIRNGGSDPYWDVLADVSVPGGQATCKPSMQSSYTTYVAIECPVITLDAAPACDSTLTLEIRLRSSTYADYGGTDSSCSAAGTMDLELQQGVTCPTCPASLIPPSNAPCDIPGRDCPATGFMTSCPCALDRRTGERKWTCPTP